MKTLAVTLWAETLKVRKSKILWLTMLFFAFVAMMMGMIVFLQQHPELTQKLGLIGMKANMVGMGEPNWKNYMMLLTQGLAGIGLIGFGFITSWVFGREYTDHTLKDLLALPVTRTSIVIAKMIVIAVWSAILSAIFLAAALLFGKIAGLTGWSSDLFFSLLYQFAMIALFSILLCTPVAFFASYSCGFLLPIGIVIITMMMANFSGLLGLTAYFPWAISGLFCVAPGTEITIQPVSYIILLTTSLIGLAGTLAWWSYADQHAK